MMTTRRWIVPAALLLAAMPAALASGFHIYEQGAKASGQAVAFVARADDASSAYYNPAAMTQLSDGAHFQFGVSAVMLGNTDFNSTASSLTPGLPPQLQPISTALFGSGPTAFDMDDNTGTPVHLNYAHKLAGTNWAFGVSFSNPFGLMTEWSDPAFKGRFSAVHTDLRTYYLSPSVAYQFGSNFSAAAGINWMFADIKDFSKRISLRPLSLPTAPETAEPLQNLQGDGDEFGWNVALHWKNDAWAIGGSYRSKMDIEVEGDLVFTDVPATSVPNIPSVFGGLAGVPYSQLFPTVQAKGTLKLPANYAIGVAFTGLEKWEVEFDVSALEWSNFDEVAIDVINPSGLVNDAVVLERWDDTLAYRLGVAWDIAEKHQLRAGGYVEDNPIPARYLRPSIPDNKRTGLTLGYGFTGERWILDAYWLHIMVDDSTVGTGDLDLTATSSAFKVIEEQSRLGSYTSDIDLLGISAAYKF